MIKDDGGWAFPAPTERTFEGGVFEASTPGMTLRDWFAGQAAASILGGSLAGGMSANDAALIASNAYALADAMIEERKK